ncbi:hypothetical protein RE6C_01174 [Rhodopirellula europaea 6C]|uniref:Uncharacterized protein n=1 Tax=Rhodopirellula europaea 6C TaxID=1263867 RepID=M2AZJ2_9BACT|nr:hypothetical protein RE6C_01174 [Rhodopirellula europaea 6C]
MPLLAPHKMVRLRTSLERCHCCVDRFPFRFWGVPFLNTMAALNISFAIQLGKPV